MRKFLTFLLLVFCFCLGGHSQTGSVSAFAVQPLSGLNVQVVGGSININGTPVVLQNTPVAVSANSTTYIFLNAAGAIATSPTAFGVGGVPLAIVTTGPNFVISISDQRTAWTGIGGGVPGQFSVKTYGAVGDAKKTFNATTTNGSSTITDATNSPWFSTDVGKKIFCTGASNANPLNVVIATISAFNSSSSISIAPAAGNGNAQAGSYCTWYTKKDTPAFTAATQAAISATTNMTAAILGYQGTVFCPPGGYVVDGPFFVQISAVVGLGVNFAGPGMFSCTIYISPDVTSSNTAWMINSTANQGFSIGGFAVDCSVQALSVTGEGFRLVNNLRARLYDIYLRGCNTTGDNTGLVYISGGQGYVIDNLFVDGNFGQVTNQPTLTLINGVSQVHVRQFHTVNPGPQPLVISGSCGGPSNGSNRATQAGGCLFESTLLDEGGNPTITIGSSSANFVGMSAYMGSPNIMTVDGTSTVFLSDANLVPFSGSCGGVNNHAINISSGGFVYATGSTISSCGTASAITGPAGATYVDDGGNYIQNCTAGTCTAVTAATYATLGFSGGIVPKATVTHTPNTCFAVTGNLLATAQNICTLLLDQNYQLVNIAAQSGGTTPASSSCATPPVITLSDGTRSETMQMTSGQTVWCSTTSGTCTASTVTNPNQVFASGALLTVSIGANTCVTSPSNVSVNYVLQSVLNP